MKTMNPEPLLPITERARQALRLRTARARKLERLARYREAARIAWTPDYFQHNEHAGRFARDLRAWCRQEATCSAAR